MLFRNPEELKPLCEIANELGWPHTLQPGLVVWRSPDDSLFARLLVTENVVSVQGHKTALFVESGIIQEGQEIINLRAEFAADGYLIEAWKVTEAINRDHFMREFRQIVSSLGDPIISEMETDDD